MICRTSAAIALRVRRELVAVRREHRRPHRGIASRQPQERAQPAAGEAQQIVAARAGTRRARSRAPAADDSSARPRHRAPRRRRARSTAPQSRTSASTSASLARRRTTASLRTDPRAPRARPRSCEPAIGCPATNVPRAAVAQRAHHAARAGDDRVRFERPQQRDRGIDRCRQQDRPRRVDPMLCRRALASSVIGRARTLRVHPSSDNVRIAAYAHRATPSAAAPCPPSRRSGPDPTMQHDRACCTADSCSSTAGRTVTATSGSASDPRPARSSRRSTGAGSSRAGGSGAARSRRPCTCRRPCRRRWRGSSA